MTCLFFAYGIMFFEVLDMKKGLILLLTILILAGCSSSVDEVKYQIYKTTYQSILNSTTFQSASENFNISASISDLGNNQIRYDVFLDQPKIAMYDVEILAIVDTGLLVISDQMMPSVGIFEDVEYHLIPYQVNADAGYPAGFNLNGISDQRALTIKVLVTWKDYFKIRSYKESFKFDLALS